VGHGGLVGSSSISAEWLRGMYGIEGPPEGEPKEIEGEARPRAPRREVQRTPGWNVLRLTHDLCERPRPSPRPRMIMRMRRARPLRRSCLRLRPKHEQP